MVVFGEYIDRVSDGFKYTDTDYSVFSDAATHVFKGQSPYRRHTYRYTPLAAYICLVNNYIHPVCGKLVFCACDLLMGLILWRIFDTINPNKKHQTCYYVGFWTFNPLTISLSTRGSNDNLISLLVFIGIYYLLKKQYVLAGIFYGLSVHFKIYPIIYSVALYLYIDCDIKLILEGRKWEAFKKGLISKNKVVFGLVSAATFFGLTYFFYLKYGYEFLYETYLYHFERKDHRHNFSVYFYMIYQLFEEKTIQWLAIATFLPQWGIVIFTGIFLYYDIFLTMFIQTTCFVMFNKVITAQYFLWYVTFLPMVLVNNKLTNVHKWTGIILVPMFIFFDFYWCRQSYRFEFLGEQAFTDIQTANYYWFWYTLVGMSLVAKNYRITITRPIVDEKTAAGAKDVKQGQEKTK
jgi:phosphatidylinositol glycan class M